jgi:hypothetical protein
MDLTILKEWADVGEVGLGLLEILLYGIMAGGIISESLGFTTKIKANNLSQLLFIMLKKIIEINRLKKKKDL